MVARVRESLSPDLRPAVIWSLPMAVAIFAAFWVVLGLGVFFVAMSGGPRRARQALHMESKASELIVSGVIFLVFAFGLIVPGFVLAFNGDNKASIAVGRVHLNGRQQEGRELFSHACGVCHTLAAVKSVGRIGPNLDKLIPTVAASLSPKEAQHDREAYVLSAIETGFARGNGQMPEQLYRGREAEDVASFVAAVAGH